MPSVADLQAIPLDELHELRDLYRRDWPRHAYTFYTLENFFCWRKHTRNGEVQVFTDPERDWRTTGTFLVKDYNELFFNTLDESNASLAKVLKTVMEGCGTSMSLVYDSCFRSTVDGAIRSLAYDKTSDVPLVCYRQQTPGPLTGAERLPPGYQFGSVRKEDRTFVEHQWEHNDPVFTNLPSRLIDRNPSLGVYDVNDRLVAWCLIDQTGSLAVFQTIDGHRRKGLGRAIIERLSKQLHGRGVLPQAYVVDSNDASRKLFENSNFHAVDLWYWTKLRPVDKSQGPEA